MTILVVGLGSIGKRHVRNLLSLGYNNISVVTSRPLPEEFLALTSYQSAQEALDAAHFDAAFICTPTANHLSIFFALLQYKVINIYVEKPLSHTTEDIAQALQLASTYKNNIKVGYDLHFDPGIQKLKQLIGQNIIGTLVSVNAFVGQYLPHWRPYEDHRKGMSAKKETGGGVLLDIVHEFDYLRWLTGQIYSVACWHVNTNSLEIETEEVAEVLLKFDNGVIGTIHLDYLQPTLVRHCTFTGTNGSITANLAKSHVEWMTHNGEKGEFNYTGFERNDRFKEIVSAFLENNADERLTTLTEALHSLLAVEAAKRSAETESIIKLENIYKN